jgi:hypothetical protein
VTLRRSSPPSRNGLSQSGCCGQTGGVDSTSQATGTSQQGRKGICLLPGLYSLMAGPGGPIGRDRYQGALSPIPPRERWAGVDGPPTDAISGIDSLTRNRIYLKPSDETRAREIHSTDSGGAAHSASLGRRSEAVGGSGRRSPAPFAGARWREGMNPCHSISLRYACRRDGRLAGLSEGRRGQSGDRGFALVWKWARDAP